MTVDTPIKIRNAFFEFFYTGFLKRIFFRQDPEHVHDKMTRTGQFLGRHAFTRGLVRLFFGYENPKLQQKILGLEFKNPIGLAAGFDKNALLTDILPSVGFGFEEVGSITGQPCFGNPKPRLWRLVKSESLLVYYGLKNDGCEAIASRLKDKKFAFPLGISLAKTNNQDTVDEQAGINDYVKAYQTFVEADIGSYFTVNISCPNTFGGEPFTTPDKLDRLLSGLRRVPSQKPVFIKMPSEMAFGVLDEMIEVARKYKIAGFISTNLAKDRNNSHVKDENFPAQGGMSGRVVQELSDRQIEYLYKKTRGEFVLIGCGGVFTAQDAYRKIRLGASLIQMITGMVFKGPEVVSEINRGLAELLERDGYKNIYEAVGRGV